MRRCQLVHLARITGYVSVDNNLSNDIAYTCRMASMVRSIHIERERNHLQRAVNVWCVVRWLQIIKFSLLCSCHPWLWSCARVCVLHGTFSNEICNMNWKWNRQQNYPVSCCGSIFRWLNRKVVDKDDDIGCSVWSKLYILQICYGERMMVMLGNRIHACFTHEDEEDICACSARIEFQSICRIQSPTYSSRTGEFAERRYFVVDFGVYIVLEFSSSQYRRHQWIRVRLTIITFPFHNTHTRSMSSPNSIRLDQYLHLKFIQFLFCHCSRLSAFRQCSRLLYRIQMKHRRSNANKKCKTRVI